MWDLCRHFVIFPGPKNSYKGRLLKLNILILFIRQVPLLSSFSPQPFYLTNTVKEKNETNRKGKAFLSTQYTIIVYYHICWISYIHIYFTGGIETMILFLFFSFFLFFFSKKDCLMVFASCGCLFVIFSLFFLLYFFSLHSFWSVFDIASINFGWLSTSLT